MGFRLKNLNGVPSLINKETRYFDGILLQEFVSHRMHVLFTFADWHERLGGHQKLRSGLGKWMLLPNKKRP